MELTNKISIYVPSTKDGNKSAKIAQYRESKRASKYFCRMYGGATQTSATGYYMSDKKGMIAERQNIIFAYCTEEQKQSTIKGVIAYAKRLCKRMSQECITVEINGKMSFIEA